MKTAIGIATVVALTAAVPYAALAQSNEPQSQQRKTVRTQVKQTLESAGFSDVQVMPESLLVRARDPSGNPVMMVVNPDSFTAVTEMGGQGTSSSNRMPNQSQKTGRNEKAPGHMNGMTSELKEDYKANLTSAQKQEIWQSLSREKTANSQIPSNYSPQVGSMVPTGISIQPLPSHVTDAVPSLNGYDYAMVQNEAVIVSPNSKKVLEIIKAQ